MWDWFAAALRDNPAIALFLTVAVAYPIGTFRYRGISLGTVAATLIVGILIGQLRIDISHNVAIVFFLLFLFAIGYRVGPQFVRGVARDGAPQALFAVVMCAVSFDTAYGAARMAGYDLSYGSGLFAGAATASAALGLSTSAIQGLGLSADETRAMVGALSTAFAMTYIFGTIGPILIISQLGPRVLRIDLAKACRAYEKRLGGSAHGAGTSWHHYVLRTYRLFEGSPQIGRTIEEIEVRETRSRCFFGQLRRDRALLEPHPATVLRSGDVVSIAGPRGGLQRLFDVGAEEVEDLELLTIPTTGVDVVVTRRAVDGKTLAELAHMEATHGIFLTRIRRGAMGDEIPILPNTAIHRGDVLTVVGQPERIRASIATIGRADFSDKETDVTTMFLMIAIGALVGVPVLMLGGVPLTLSTAGGVLFAGIAAGWQRSTFPTFGNIPPPVIWFMNVVGLNLFIAVIGITSGSSFVEGVQHVGLPLFLWGMLATSLPVTLGLLIGKYIFRFDDALVLGCCAGASTSTATLGLLTDQAESQVPTLGYTIPYAVSNTLLTIGGILMVTFLK
ncbi:putative transport protein [Kaistia soli DSM 19436]|uniref:Putative transport protein n=1 Tax=Kaistia soli DSM 19436 TaxID=1122133 RepID=A0A1M5I916_9HYPH|nr:aspartate-alanine antiporter [Kaistia soli]SHG24888.1 putative transport protein [Kaistia soli DSM 19436]